jgi:DNA-binding CsgD family transcriptional regulator
MVTGLMRQSPATETKNTFMKEHDNQPTNAGGIPSGQTNSVSYEEACRCYLTDTEIRVLKLVNEGFTSNEIAARLGNKPSTVQTHRKQIKQKLNLNGYRSLERWCHKYAEEIRQYVI